MKKALKFIKQILLFSLLTITLGCEPEEIIVIRKTFQVTASSEKTNIYVNEELPFTVSISNKDINNEEILSASFQINKSTGYIVFNEQIYYPNEKFDLPAFDTEKEFKFSFFSTAKESNIGVKFVISSESYTLETESIAITSTDVDAQMSFENITTALLNKENYFTLKIVDDKNIWNTATAKFTKGTGTVLIANTDATTNVAITSGNNEITYIPTSHGESIIEFTINNKFGSSIKKTAIVNVTSNYVLSLTASPEQGGTVTGGGTFTHGQIVGAIATPATGYSFDGWYKNSAKESDLTNYSFPILSDITLTAKFLQNQYTVQSSAEQGGTATGGGTFTHGQKATVSVTADDGYSFDGWYEGTTRKSTLAEYEFTVTYATHLTAKFKQIQYTVSVSADQGGTVSITGGPTYTYGQNPILTATPASGYSFDGWYEGTTKINSTAQFILEIKSNRNLTAKFVLSQYTIEATAEQGGTVTGGGVFIQNQNVSLTATPASGYSFDGWYQGLIRVSQSANYSFNALNSLTLVAKFKINQYIITISADQGGTANSGISTYTHGESVLLTALPNSEQGYQFDGWYEGTTRISTQVNYSFTAMKSTTITAKFTQNQYNILVSGQQGGTVTGGGLVSHGTFVRLFATPASGYSFDGWYENDNLVGTNVEFNFNATGSRTLIAKFKATITVNTSEGGTVTGGKDYSLGANATVTAIPNTGYQFEGWYEGSTLQSQTASYTFVVTRQISLTAKFKQIQYTIFTSAETGGTATGGGTISHGTFMSLTATPATGYQFDGWYEGTSLVSTNLNYTFTATASRTLIAKFKATITVNTSEGGTATGGGAFTNGTNTTVVATPNTGYSFDGWYEGTSLQSQTASYTFTVTRGISLTAKFKQIQHTITVSPDTGGTVTGGGTHLHGAFVNLLATPASGYSFDGWYEGTSLVSTNLNYTFTATASRVLIAKFKATITVNTSEGGTATGGGMYSVGANATLTATPATGYQFDGWYEGTSLQSINQAYTFTVTKTTSLMARFSLKQYTVSLTPQVGGTVTGSGTYLHGQTIAVVATPNTGYQFDGWWENNILVSLTNTYSITIIQNRNLVARYSAIMLNITANTEPQGTVTGGGTVQHGQTATVTAIPNTGYSFEGWYEGTTRVSQSAVYSFTATANRNLTAKYVLTTYTISASSSLTAGGTVTGGGTYLHGQTVTLTASTPNTGYQFDGWYEGTTRTTTDRVYSFVASSNKTLVAQYSVAKHLVSAVIVTNGMQSTAGGTVSGTGLFTHGQKGIVTATPKSGYYFKGWSDSSSQPYIFTTSPSYLNFTATSPSEYWVYFASGATITFKRNNTTATITGGSWGEKGYAQGTVITVTTNQSSSCGRIITGYDSWNEPIYAYGEIPFLGWYEGTTMVSANSIYTFTVGTTNRTLEARWGTQCRY